jgi:putative tryptophan/tyrosine transport system substrate-binding protein
MNRRLVLLLIATTFSTFLTALAARAEASERMRRIGFLGNYQTSSIWQAFLEGLRERGWDEGRTIVIESRWAQGKFERYPELAAELVSRKVDLIVAAAPPAAQAAQRATRTIPIVMVAVANPVEAGFVVSLSRPGGNITGVASNAGAGLFSKLLQLTKEALPSARRIGVLFNRGNPLNYGTAQSPELLSAAAALGLEIVWLPVERAEDFSAAFAEAQLRSVDAVFGIGDPLVFAERRRIHDLAEAHRVPTVWLTREYLADRGLLSLGPSLHDMFRRVAPYIDKLLRGADPATLAVEMPTGYELVVNIRAARALGLTIPDTVLARADEVIE